VITNQFQISDDFLIVAAGMSKELAVKTVDDMQW
jgi:hypothetical protein